MKSILNILKINDQRSGTSQKNGKPWTMQDAECLLLDDDGNVDQVGVLQIPRNLIGTVSPGMYIGTFALRPEMTTRRIQAVLTGLQPYAVPSRPGAAAPAPASPSKPV